MKDESGERARQALPFFDFLEGRGRSRLLKLFADKQLRVLRPLPQGKQWKRRHVRGPNAARAILGIDEMPV